MTKEEANEALFNAAEDGDVEALKAGTCRRSGCGCKGGFLRINCGVYCC